jgi:hypothetical protein
MASEIGRAVVFGIDGTMLYNGVAAMPTTGNELQKAAYEDQCNVHESKSKKGETIGLVFWNQRKKLTIDFYPCAAAGTGAITTAIASIIMPALGAKVTLASMSGADLNSAAWIYQGGGTVEQTNEGEVKMKPPLMQYSTDISTPTT